MNVIGRNTIGYLGDDASGIDCEQTWKMGVSTLAFRFNW